jgi:membrane-bound lytic murein transglycosylase B
VGPLQFLPESWRQFGDGGDPQNIADAAPAAARLLCSGDRDLRDPQDWTDAVFAYNRSGQYLADVRDAAANYALGQPVA